MSLSRSWTVLSLILGLILAATVAGCAAPDKLVPTSLPAAQTPMASDAGDSAARSSDPVSSAAITDPFVAWPAFAACLRTHGLAIADPQLDAVGEPHWGDDLKRSLTQAVRTACAPIIAVVDEGGTLRGHGVPSYSTESLVAHSACLRAHGMGDWPDPEAGATNWVWPTSFARNDPRVIAALDACEGTLVGAQASPSAGS